MAKCLVLPTLDYKAQGLNPAVGGIQLMTVWCFIEQSLLSSFHHLIMA